MTMDIYSPSGTLVRYNGGTEAYQWDPTPPDQLVRGGVYVVDRTIIHDWHTGVRLKGIKGEFNVCWFDEVEDE